MDNQQMTDFVIRALSRHQPMSSIIQAVCEKTGMNWAEAEKFVRSVQQEKKDVIAVKQSPLLLIMGLGAILVGLGMITYSVMVMLDAGGLTTRLDLRILGTGALLLLGGIIGIWNTIQQLWNS